MAIDLSDDLVAALTHPKVGAALAQQLKPVVQQVLVEHDNVSNALLDGAQCGTLFCRGKDPAAAWAGQRRRNPELDKISVGSGKQRRWRRSDLEQIGRILGRPPQREK